MAKTDKYTTSQIISAIKGSGGIKVVICDRLGCARQTLDTYLEKYPKIFDALKEEKEKQLDAAELLIITNIGLQRRAQVGDPNAQVPIPPRVVDSSDAWKLLEKLGRKRGFANNLDITSDGEKIIVTLKGD